MWCCGVQGNCTTDPSEEFLAQVGGEVAVLPREAGMCMLLTSHDVLYHRTKNLWLENLYIRVVRNASTVETPLTLLSVSDPTFDTNLWITNSMLQGDGGPNVTGLTVSSKAHVRGVHLLLSSRKRTPLVQAACVYNRVQHSANHTTVCAI